MLARAGSGDRIVASWWVLEAQQGIGITEGCQAPHGLRHPGQVQLCPVGAEPRSPLEQ